MPQPIAPLTHDQVQTWLHSPDHLTSQQKDSLSAHLAACPQCREYAALIHRMEADLPLAAQSPALTESQIQQHLQALRMQSQQQRVAARLSGAVRTTALVALFAGLLLLIYFSGGQLGLPFGRGFSPGQPLPTGTPSLDIDGSHTATPLPILTELIPSPTFTPAPSPTPSPPPLVSVWPEIGSADIHAGPGVDYEIIGSALSGIEYQSVAGTADGNWIQIEYPPSPSGQGWIYAPYLQIGDGGLPVLAGLPTPTVFTPDGQPPLPVELLWQSPPRPELPTQQGWLYFVVRQVSPPFSRQLGRLTLDCLYTSSQCPAELIPGWPENGDYTLSWSPSGSLAALADLDSRQILLLNPQTASWALLKAPFPAVNDRLLWSPDGAWIAASLQVTDQDSALVTLISSDGSQERTLVPELAGFQAPIAWLDPGNLLIEVRHIPPKGSSELPRLPMLYTVDINTGVWQEFQVQSSDLGPSFPVFSPDSSRFIIPMPIPAEPTGGLVAINRDDWQALPIGMDGISAAWSPDGQWLALVRPIEGGQQVFINRPDWQQVFFWPGSTSLLWMPDSRHLLVTAWATQDAPTTLFLIDTLQGDDNLQGSVRQLVNPADFPLSELIFPSVQPPAVP